MEKFGRTCLLAVACIIAGLGCSKNESNVLETASVSDASTTYKLTVPPVPGYTPPKGIEPGQPIPYPVPPKTVPNGSSTINYGNPSADYLEGTCLFTISHLEEGSTYHQINNDKINMAFYNGDGDKRPISVRRLKPATPSPYGWTAHWNTLQWVENERPEVLFTNESDSTFTIVFSKPCVKFGMELSPNIQNVHCFFEVFWGNFVGDLSSGSFGQEIQTPSGAKLFSLETKTPFTVVTVNIPTNWFYTEKPQGVAIANIRYKLAK